MNGQHTYNQPWEAHTSLRDGYARIVFADGGELTVKDDGIGGADFTDHYLTQMEADYPNHLLAADLKLRSRLGSNAYKVLRGSQPRRYRHHLALVSLNCCFGREDEVPDHRSDGRMTPEFVACPERYCCQYNGYNPALRDKQLVCCNPIFNTGLTRTQARLADLLANTGMSREEMAAALGCSIANIDHTQTRIYAAMQVRSRAELTEKLRGRRVV